MKSNYTPSDMARIRKIVIASNILWLVVGLTLGILILLAELAALSVKLPSLIILSGTAVCIAVLLFPCIGLLMVFTQKRSLCLLYFNSVLSVILVLSYAFTVIYTLIYVSGLDQGSELFGAWDSLTGMVEGVLVEMTARSTEDGLLFQELFGCCGVSFRTTYLFAQYDLNVTDFLESQLIGPACENLTSVLTIHSIFPNYVESAELEADTIFGLNYFCNDVILGLVNDNIAIFAIVGAGTTALALLAAFGSCFLTFITQDVEPAAASPIVVYYEKDDGRGTNEDTEESEEFPEGKGEPIYRSEAKTPIIPGSGAPPVPPRDMSRPPPPPPRRIAPSDVKKEYQPEPGFENELHSGQNEDEHVAGISANNGTKGSALEHLKTSSRSQTDVNSLQNQESFGAEAYESDESDSFFGDSDSY